ncbi:MAG: ShlB/FhaC/HecB family hemolysin secretion/activation protein [Rhodocyclaceae bacterium]|nr:ShlB/FhaC/HecB family hemolysin secretion/activation protein [Rhodocyclaceae bacterium]
MEVRGFRLNGLVTLPNEPIIAQLAPFIGPDKSMADLRAAARQVQETLRNSGLFAAQAFIPKQNISDQIVEIRVLEGRLGKVEVNYGDDVKISHRVIDAYKSRLLAGEALNAEHLEGPLFLMSDLRGVRITSTLQPGDHPGDADLVIAVERGRLYDIEASLDNYGSRYSGVYRGTGGVIFNNPLRLGDQLDFKVLASQSHDGKGHLRFGRASYLAPVGPYGTKLGFAVMGLEYRLGEDVLVGETPVGNANVKSLFALHPIVRSRDRNLFLQASFEKRRLEDIKLSDVSRKRLDIYTLGLVGDVRDGLFGGGISNFSLSLAAGQLTIESPNSLSFDQTSARTNGKYNKLSVQAGRFQTLPYGNFLYLSLQGQLASKNLDNSEKFGLGGPGAVRAFPVGEASGDDGYVFSWELRRPIKFDKIPGEVVAFVFGDHGHTKLFHNGFVGDSTFGITQRSMSAIGIGATWAKAGSFALRVTAAWPGAERSVVENGGSNSQPRIYAQGSLFF